MGIFSFVKDYNKVERHINYLVIAEFFVQLINSSFLLIQPLFMKSEGYTDGETAGFISFRFLGLLLLALPVGIYIRRRRIKPLFIISSLCVPAFALIIIYATSNHSYWLLMISQLLWGASFTFLQICSLPYILRNANEETHTESITLNYSTWSIAGIASGCLIAILGWINNTMFDEKSILTIIGLLGFISFYFIQKIKINEKLPSVDTSLNFLRGYDWSLIAKALAPTIMIAVGAGLTIPFISLFFSNVHHLSTSTFSIIASVTSVAVAFASLQVPRIKRAIGYKVAVPTTQGISILSLVCLATTQYYSEVFVAVYIAIICYIVRQPLMNLAGPMTSEIVMGYVGERNREMVSALTSAIWSGSWFLSSVMFKVFRNNSWEYVEIFLITALLYTIGVIWYSYLIRDYEKRFTREA